MCVAWRFLQLVKVFRCRVVSSFRRFNSYQYHSNEMFGRRKAAQSEWYLPGADNNKLVLDCRLHQQNYLQLNNGLLPNTTTDETNRDDGWKHFRFESFRCSTRNEGRTIVNSAIIVLAALTTLEQKGRWKEEITFEWGYLGNRA